MNILLVEDRDAEVVALSTLLQAQGHTVVVCPNGNAAYDQFLRQRPDVVVTSAFVPGLDGFSLTEAIQQHVAPRWQPVIVVAAECDETLQARAIQAGADSFFVSPVPAAALAARLTVIERLLAMQHDAEARLAQLSRYLATEEEDLHIARHLLHHQMSPDGSRRLEDPAVEIWQEACPRLGGNMVSVGRAPNGVLHVMLADASGYGLSAAVSLLPLIGPFHRMTAKGFGLPTIVRELNAKVSQALPGQRTVAAQLVAVDTREGIGSVWNGGMPNAFMLDGFGHHFKEFALSHPPLGSQRDHEFGDHVEQHAFSRGEQLVLVSDGLLDAVGPAGVRFGEEGLAAALVGLPRSQRRDELMAAIDAHLSGMPPEDDMTLLLIDCEKEAAPADHPAEAQAKPAVPAAPPASAAMHGHWHFQLQLDGRELGRLDVVPLLLDVASRFDAAQPCAGKLFVILSELYNNALDHGILRLDSRLKHSHDGLETWLLLREERLATLDRGEIRLTIEQFAESGRPWLRIRCRDSGPGFDVAAALAKLEQQSLDHVDLRLHGRGLALVRQMTEHVGFSDTGNEVTALLPLDRA